jgi:hypothetical protein
LEEVVEGQSDESLELPPASPSLRNALEDLPGTGSSALAASVRNAPPAALRPRINSQEQAIADLRKEIESVLAETRDATGNFPEIDRLQQVKSLPPAVSSKITILANQARDVRLAVGSDAMIFQHRDEMQAVDGLVVVDEASGDLTAKDAPQARKELAQFVQRYSEPSDVTQKALWRYVNSVFSACDRSLKDAEPHLQHARSLEAAGNKSEALREYREIYQIYPNPITAEKIRQLEP